MSQPCYCPSSENQNPKTEQYQASVQEQSPGYSQPNFTLVPCPVGQKKSEQSKVNSVESQEQSAQPCPSLPESYTENAQILEVTPCPNIQQYQNVLAQTVDIIPLDQTSQEQDPDTEKRKREECWKRFIETTENIVPIDYENPDLANSPLDDCILLSYVDQGPWECLVDMSAHILGDEALPCDYAGLLDEDGSENDKNFEKSVERYENRNANDNGAKTYRSVCTDDQSKI